MTRDVTSFVPAKPTWCSRRPGLGVCKPAIAPQPPPDRPDPAIYSQAPLIAAGGTATWDNPDIVLYATPQNTSGEWSIAPQWFLDNALITVRNNSATAAAVNTIVAISYAPMGIGMPRTPLTTLMISLLAGEVRQLSLPLPSAILNEPVKSVGLFVDIAHPYDSNLTNDHGANMMGIDLLGAGISGATPIALGNTTSSPITYNLSIEPNTIGATLSSTSVTVAPGATGGVAANFPTLGNPPGQTEFTVVARDDSGNLLGGFTSALYFG